MKILVTGGAGFIGSNLVDELIKKNHQVIVVDNLSTGSEKNINSKAEFHECDIKHPNLKNMFENIDVVYHFAAQIDVRKSVENPIEDVKENMIGSLNVRSLTSRSEK